MPEKRQSERNLLQRKKKRSKLQRKINGLHSMISGRYSQTTHLSPKSKYVSDPGKGSYQLKKLRNRRAIKPWKKYLSFCPVFRKTRRKEERFEILDETFSHLHTKEICSHWNETSFIQKKKQQQKNCHNISKLPRFLGVGPRKV